MHHTVQKKKMNSFVTYYIKIHKLYPEHHEECNTVLLSGEDTLYRYDKQVNIS